MAGATTVTGLSANVPAWIGLRDISSAKKWDDGSAYSYNAGYASGENNVTKHL
jgi:hypothetical protein